MADIDSLSGTDSVSDCLDSVYNDLVELNTQIAAIEAGSGVLVSSNDSTTGYLNGKLLGTASVIVLTEGNDGADETLTVSISDIFLKSHFLL